MKKYFITTRWIKHLFSKSLIWDLPQNEKIIYLTFDDGPTPGVTDNVLDLLKAYNAKATFCCIGKNVMRNLNLYQEILSQKHAVGNHTQNHNKGVKTKDAEYYKSIDEYYTGSSGNSLDYICRNISTR